VVTIKKLLKQLGAEISEDEGACRIQARKIASCEAAYELVKTMRASVLVLGPLLARCREAHISLPGGCAIGPRPINLHLLALEKMGAEIRVEHGMIHAKASRLRGAHIDFDMPTVTGTENLMMAAVTAEGTTILEHAACEPEVVDLALFLNACGAQIEGAGTDRITIHGVASLKGVAYHVMPDRIEAGTFMVAAAITRGVLAIRHCRPDHLASIIDHLQDTGATVIEGNDFVVVKGAPAHKKIRSVDVKTLPYPGFPTDMQAQMMALMSVAEGLSVITETIFDGRFNHVAELKRMGAQIRLEGSHAFVKGVPHLSGAPVMASDLRASASLILSGLVAEGETEISRVYHLDRGYERIEEKLSRVGAIIRRVSGESL
jgi:UDP-N-acetylglucosamine 1-carboxyvinyltransferase